jgi:hypothetical protein
MPGTTRRLALIIVDGFGVGDGGACDAISAASMPILQPAPKPRLAALRITRAPAASATAALSSRLALSTTITAKPSGTLANIPCKAPALL